MKVLKWFLWILNVCLLGVALFLGVKIYENKVIADANERVAQAISLEEKEMTKNHDCALQSGMIDKTFVSVAYPIDESKKIIGAVENEMKTYVKKEFGSSDKVSDVENLAFLDTKSSDTGIEKVKKYSLHLRRYHNGKEAVTKVKDTAIKEILVGQDGTVFELTKLVSDGNFLKEKLLKKLENSLTEANQLNDNTKPQLDSLKQQDVKTLTFDVSNGLLNVTLPDKIGNQDKISLPLSDIFEKIDANYLKGSDLEAYKAYQAEKKRAEALASGRLQVAIEGKVVALTFDDGPNSSSTPRILDTLKQYNAKATFFVIGSSVPGNEAILKRAVSEGHEIGNHTWSHPSLATLSVNDIKWQMSETSKVITSATGKEVKLMRPPYGATNATVQANVGYPQILWDVDTLDWKNRNTQAILGNVQSQVAPGAVILMHDIHGTTADALPAVMDYLVSQGYRFVTVSELYGF